LNYFPSLLLPTVWIATPIWLLLLFLILRHKASHTTVWGFLLKPSAQLASHKRQTKRSWLHLLTTLLAGSFCFYIFSFPYQKVLHLYLNEPHLIRELNPSEKAKWHHTLKTWINENNTLYIDSPNRDFHLKGAALSSIFQLDFNQPNHESPFAFNYSGEFKVETGLFASLENLPFLPMTNPRLNNSHGIYGVRSNGKTLSLAIWSTNPKHPLTLTWNKNSLPLEPKRWQYLECPTSALGQIIRLEPSDDLSLDNSLDLRGFNLQTLTWSSDQKLPETFTKLLNEQTLWVDHEKLSIQHNQNNFESPQTKRLHFITKPLTGVSQLIAPDLYRQIYSTSALSQSSRHHGLQWPLLHSPLVALIGQPSFQDLWFNETSIFAQLDSSRRILNTSLDTTTFKTPLNLKAHELMLQSLYPNLKNPWLIQRDPLSSHAPSPHKLNPKQFYNLNMACLLLITALLGILNSRFARARQ